MFRRVDLPTRIPGKLLLHSMPGRFETLDRVWAQVKKEEVRAIVCLAEKREVQEKSADYARALEAGKAPCAVLAFEVPDRGVPEDKVGFHALASDVAMRLQSGDVVLVHCAGGVGRTAMLAVSVLVALGESVNDARSAVSQAGSTVETASQREMILWCAAQANV